ESENDLRRNGWLLRYRYQTTRYQSTSHRPASILFLFFLRRQFTEVLFDNIAIVGGELLADLLDGLFLFLRRQTAPAAVVADVLALHFARAFAFGGAAFGGRIAGTNAIGIG